MTPHRCTRPYQDYPKDAARVARKVSITSKDGWYKLYKAGVKHIRKSRHRKWRDRKLTMSILRRRRTTWSCGRRPRKGVNKASLKCSSAASSELYSLLKFTVFLILPFKFTLEIYPFDFTPFSVYLFKIYSLFDFTPFQLSPFNILLSVKNLLKTRTPLPMSYLAPF